MKDIPLWENEENLLETKIGLSGMIANTAGGRMGKLMITNLRIVCSFPGLGLFYEMPHDMITSFKWDSGFMKGGNFKITWFVNQQSAQIHYQTNNKKKIVKILEKMPYYDQPAVLKPWVGQTQENNISDENNLVSILKTRYVKGEITKEEFDEMKKELE
jgi:hypothetical protein